MFTYSVQENLEVEKNANTGRWFKQSSSLNWKPALRIRNSMFLGLLNLDPDPFV
jgi:hypothetical protein